MELLLTVAAALLLGALCGAWIDIAYLGIMVRAWGFGEPRALARKGEKAFLHHRFGKSGPLFGWILSPWEVIVTSRRFIVNYRNAFSRLDIPLDSIKSIKVHRKPWPVSDDMLIGYSDNGTPKQYLLSDNASAVLRALEKAAPGIEIIYQS